MVEQGQQEFLSPFFLKTELWKDNGSLVMVEECRIRKEGDLKRLFSS